MIAQEFYLFKRVWIRAWIACGSGVWIGTLHVELQRNSHGQHRQSIGAVLATIHVILQSNFEFSHQGCLSVDRSVIHASQEGFLSWKLLPLPCAVLLETNHHPIGNAMVRDAAALTCGRRAWRHPRSLCLVGVALGDIGLHLVWQAWHFWHWAGSGDALGRGWSAVMPRFFVWQAWHLVTSTVTLCGRRGTYGTGLPWWHRLTPTSFTQTAFRHLHRSRTYFFQCINSQTFSHATFSHRTLSPDLSSTISFLFPAFPIPSSPFFCYLLEEV